MELFGERHNPSQNLLPEQGEVFYHGRLFPAPIADHYFRVLWEEIDWKNDQAVIYGKTIHTKRKVAWYGDRRFSYTYSKTTKTALPWTPILLELRKIVESHCHTSFNSCLLNLYHNGAEGMTWHSDDEKEIEKNGSIASLSFGAERRFVFKHKTSGEKVARVLEHGSLLVMRGATQSHWRHSLPTTKKVDTPRINLTFRKIVLDNQSSNSQ